jgi:transposase
MKRKTRRMSVRTIKEICRLYFNFDISIRSIAGACNISSSTAHAYIARLKESEITYDELLKMSDDQLRHFFTPEKDTSSISEKKTLDYSYLNEELKRKGVTLQLLFEEYRSAHPDGYGRSQFYDMFRTWKKALHPSMKQIHKYGDRMFVDFSGTKPHYINPETGEIIEPEFYVAVLGGSSYTFACAVNDQTIESFIHCTINAFEFFGGCPKTIVPDNLKAAVTKADYYDPDINRTFADMAEHYDVAVLPTRVAKPKDKAKVENAVLNTQRRIIAALRDQTFFSLDELNEAIAEELDAFNNRPMQQTGKSRYTLFAECEQQELKPLPERRFDIFHWLSAKINLEYHFKVGTCFYSVPYTLIGKKVDIRHNKRIVEAFYKGQRVACHLKSHEEGACITEKAHMCHEHLHYLEWTPERIEQQAQLIGTETSKFIKQIYETQRSVDNAFRGALGIIRLSKQYSPERLEVACELALAAGARRYKNVKQILVNGMDQFNQETDEHTNRPVDHSNLRGSDYYKETDNDTKYH